MKGIATYVIWKPAYAKGTGKFIKPADKQPFRTERQRESIIARNRRYLDKHRHKIKVFSLYEHPGNQLILRWPAQAGKVSTLSLWLLDAPDRRSTTDGTRIIRKYFPSGDQAKYQKLFDLMLGTVAAEVDQNHLWQARIFEQPGNQTLFAWDHREGETWPGHALKTFELKQTLADLQAQLDSL